MMCMGYLDVYIDLFCMGYLDVYIDLFCIGNCSGMFRIGNRVIICVIICTGYNVPILT